MIVSCVFFIVVVYFISSHRVKLFFLYLTLQTNLSFCIINLIFQFYIKITSLIIHIILEIEKHFFLSNNMFDFRHKDSVE